jgi:ribosomal protein S18 acetylase RimI-like enzyme
MTIRHAMWGKDVIETYVPVKTYYMEQYLDGVRKDAITASVEECPLVDLQGVQTDPELFRWLYNKVGTDYKWVFFRNATTKEIDEYLRGKIMYLAIVDNNVVGFTLLEDQSVKLGRNVVNISYIGLFPEYIGCGYGTSMLFNVLELIGLEGQDPVTVWLYTTSTDHPNAFRTYQKVGFQCIRQEHDHLWVGTDLLEADSDV